MEARVVESDFGICRSLAVLSHLLILQGGVFLANDIAGNMGSQFQGDVVGDAHVLAEHSVRRSSSLVFDFRAGKRVFIIFIMLQLHVGGGFFRISVMFSLMLGILVGDLRANLHVVTGSGLLLSLFEIDLRVICNFLRVCVKYEEIVILYIYIHYIMSVTWLCMIM